MSLPLITYAEAFAFLHFSGQASIYSSKTYMDLLIKVFEHIKLVSGITASELKPNKSGYSITANGNTSLTAAD